VTLRHIALREISAEAFARWSPPQKVIVHEHARRFGAIDLVKSGQSIAISWRSEIVEPVVVVGDQSDIWVGVDQRIACVRSDGSIVVSLGLASSVLHLRYFSSGAVVLCETEAVVFNRDFSIRAIRGLGELPCDVVARGGERFVVFEDGSQDCID